MLETIQAVTPHQGRLVRKRAIERAFYSNNSMIMPCFLHTVYRVDNRYLNV